MGEIGLQMITDAFAEFKSALGKRGILNESGHIHSSSTKPSIRLLN